MSTKPQDVTYNIYYLIHCNNAKSKGFTPLSKNDWLSIVSLPCSYCGKTDERTACSYGTYRIKKQLGIGGEYSVRANGVDRIDSNFGYTIDNVAPCCATCNIMKLNMSKDDFLNRVSKIYKCQRK